jgi:hypothetical protein
MTLKLARMDGGTVDLPPEVLQSFRTALKGHALTADDPPYEESRQVWNAMIDRRPGLVARCTGTVDVVQAVRFARQHGLLSSVRGGGHNIAGLAVCEGGLMIDMSLLKGVWVDPVRRTARAQTGCTAWQPCSGLSLPPGLQASPSAAPSATSRVAAAGPATP